jgi:hypothetical protein
VPRAWNRHLCRTHRLAVLPRAAETALPPPLQTIERAGYDAEIMLRHVGDVPDANRFQAEQHAAYDGHLLIVVENAAVRYETANITP